MSNKKFIDDRADKIMNLFEEKATVQWNGEHTHDKIRSCNTVYWMVRQQIEDAISEGQRLKLDEMFPPCIAPDCGDQEGGRCVHGSKCSRYEAPKTTRAPVEKEPPPFPECPTGSKGCIFDQKIRCYPLFNKAKDRVKEFVARDEGFKIGWQARSADLHKKAANSRCPCVRRWFFEQRGFNQAPPEMRCSKCGSVEFKTAGSFGWQCYHCGQLTDFSFSESKMEQEK